MRKSFREVKLSLHRIQAPEPYHEQLKSARDAAKIFRKFIGDDPREHFVALYLDTKHKLIAVHRVSVGTATSSLVNPREVFGPAVALSATALIVGHNHPSGNLEPSEHDKAVTKRLSEAGELLDITLLDHIIITHDKHYSFADSGSI